MEVCSLYIAIIVLSIIIVLKIFTFKKPSTKPTHRQGIVILHQFERGLGVPNLSPFCLKLETYLRMAKIPYDCDFTFQKGKKGKTPFIEYNGKQIEDSSFCIEFLNKEFGVDLDEGLTEEQKGVARAVQVMLEENTFWTLAMYRFFGNQPEIMRDFVFRRFIFPLKHLIFWRVQRKLKGYLYSHGIGRHSTEEIYGIAEKDLRSVSAILGKKKFIFGDTPCVVDAVLFGTVADFIWYVGESPQAKLIMTELKNLVEHAQRMREAYYPDWDELVHGKEKVD